MNVKEKFLPIGTVVMLKGGSKRLMIIGFCMEAKQNNQNVKFDYAGCLFPEGIIDSNEFALFNHDQIEKVYNEAYSDETTKKFISSLVEFNNKNGN